MNKHFWTEYAINLITGTCYGSSLNDGTKNIQLMKGILFSLLPCCEYEKMKSCLPSVFRKTGAIGLDRNTSLYQSIYTSAISEFQFSGKPIVTVPSFNDDPWQVPVIRSIAYWSSSDTTFCSEMLIQPVARGNAPLFPSDRVMQLLQCSSWYGD